MARFTFHNARYQSSFEDLFDDSGSYDTQWYRLWTGDSSGDRGDFVETAFFNEYGNGWIEKKDLQFLDIDYQQYGDTELWVKPWDGGQGEWEYSLVDFSVETLDAVTREIRQTTPMNEMFVHEDVPENTWYRLWIGESGNKGDFVDTSKLNPYGKGWVLRENLDQIYFSLDDAGKELWVKTWTPENRSGSWEHWIVETPGYDTPHPGVKMNSSLQLDWIDTEQTSQFPHRAIGLIEVDHVEGDGYVNIGTGFMISPEHCMTATHVIEDEWGNVDSDTRFRFYPGLNGTREQAVEDEKFSSGTHVSFLNEDAGNVNSFGWPDNDMAIITLDDSSGYDSGWFKPRWNESDDLKTLPVKSAGYSGGAIQQDDPDTSGSDLFQWGVSGTITGYSSDGGSLKLSDSLTSTAGASGSPIFYEFNNDAYFAGVYSGFIGETPVAANLDSDSFEWMMGVLQSDGYEIGKDFAFQ